MRLSRRLLVVAIALLSICLGIVLAWAIDQSNDSNTVARNVTLAGRDIGGLNQAELQAVIDNLASEYESTSLVINGEAPFSIPGKAFDLEINEESTTTGALQTRKTGDPFSQIGSWVKSFAIPTRASVDVTFDQAKLRTSVLRGDPGQGSPPTEPTFEIRDGRLDGIAGEDGSGIDPSLVAARIADASRRGTPLKVRAEQASIPPRFSEADADALAADIESRVLTPLEVEAGGVTETLENDFFRPSVRTQPAAEGLGFAIDRNELQAGLERRMERAARAPVQAQWTVENDQPRVSPGENGRECCEDGASAAVADVLQTRFDEDGNTNSPIELPMSTVEPQVTQDDIPRLGINEPIGSFTTEHPPGQPRVENIHRIADLVRGQVILPGDTFSLNGHVGPRTREKGFVSDGVIQNSEFQEAVGGGISQFATTLFNAAFFGGLDYGEYQAHTIYISRYPYGREATISYPHPDLQIRNTTPHGVLIWPSYTDTSITVTLYSTPHATGEQTGQSESPRGECTRVETERTRQYVDGHEAKDTVVAIYQPEEGVSC